MGVPSTRETLQGLGRLQKAFSGETGYCVCVFTGVHLIAHKYDFC